jgi:uncharacterized protein (TIGR04255 family)
MSADFPFQIPDHLPDRIDPCPIVEAVLEIRFVTQESWSVMPGLLYNCIRERYPEMKDLPLKDLPEQFRRGEPLLTHKPLVQFLGSDFLIQFGPRVVSLITKPDAYPGWSRVRTEMAALLDDLQRANIIAEGERLSARYIDFFAGNVFPHLLIGGHIGGNPLVAPELTLTTVFHRPPLTGRLMVTNGAIIRSGESSRMGSVLDMDIWAAALDFDLFADGLAKFDDVHKLAKGVFFGLLRPEFLETLNPEYS